MWTELNQLWHVRRTNDSKDVWIGSGLNREDVKRRAHRWFGDNPDNYVVTPLTEKKDRVSIEITLAV